MKNAAYPTLFSLVFMLNQAFCPPSVTAADFVIVESGTVITAIILENLSTADGSVQKGNAVKMVVGQDVIVAGQKVVTKGSPAEGIILNVKREKDVRNYPDRLLRLEVVLKWVRAVDG